MTSEEALPDAARHARFRAVVLPNLDDGFNLARWLTGSPGDAEDVVQEASLRAFKYIGGYQGPNARAWFLTIVRRSAFAWLRVNRPQELNLVEDAAELERRYPQGVVELRRRGEETPEAQLMGKRAAADLNAMVAALPPEYREVVVLREIEDLSYKEIAEIAAIPIGTVMSRLARARKLLLRRYQEREVHESAHRL